MTRPRSHSQDHRVLAVHFLQQHPDHLALRGREVLADVVGPDRQLPVTAVDQDGQLHRPRPPQVAERVQRRAHRPARVQDVVDQDDDLAVDAGRRHVGVTQRPRRAQPQVIAVHGDVEGAGGGGTALDLGQPLGQPAGQRHAPGRDAQQDDVGAAVGALQDLVRDPGQGPADLGLPEDGLAAGGCAPTVLSGGAVAGGIAAVESPAGPGACIKRTPFPASQDGP